VVYFAGGKESVGDVDVMTVKIQSVVDRMRCFFWGTGMKSASRQTVMKWAQEIEDVLKETESQGSAKNKRSKTWRNDATGAGYS
jgi:hypothetical protein